jgi:allantoin racemase
VAEILWVNPVGVDDFDRETLALIERIRSPEHTARVCHLESGPPHLEYHLYEHLAFSPMLKLMQEAEIDGCGAGIIGCFYDGGLRELREALSMPIVGMGEASVLLAATLGHRFSIIVGRRKWIPKMHDNVLQYGLGSRLASFRSVEMSIPAIAGDPDEFERRVLEESVLAIEEDGAEVVILSELVPPRLAAKADKELPVPLLDPGMASWKWAEMAADLYQKVGLSHARAFGYEPPPPGEFST